MATGYLTEVAEKICEDLDLGTPQFLRQSSAATFLTEETFLRLALPDQDSSGTLQVARCIAESIGGAKPLIEQAIPVTYQEFTFHVELYERLYPVRYERPTATELGHMLAELHNIDVTGQALRDFRRIDACRMRLSWAPQSTHELLAPHVDSGVRALELADSTRGICHGDPSRGNLMYTKDGLVWTDFEYAGLGPLATDVGFCIVELSRFIDRETSRQFIAAYFDAGGTFDPVDTMMLAGLRDLYGVVDYCYQTSPTAVEEFEHRLASFDELFKLTGWQKRP